jgi:single-strand DNA-binding protein
VARYTLAVDRRFKREGEQSADFISCVVFGKGAEFTDKYLRQGTKIAVTGRIQTGSYTNKNGAKVYTTQVVADQHYFCESKKAEESSGQQYTRPAQQTAPQQPRQQEYNYQQSGFTNYGDDGFMNIPDGIDEELPFN